MSDSQTAVVVAAGAAAEGLRLFCLCFVGTAALYMVCKCSGTNQVTLLKAWNVKIDKTTPLAVVAVDMIITSLLGAVIMYFLVGPTTNAQAVTAGFGFTGAMNAIKKEADNVSE